MFKPLRLSSWRELLRFIPTICIVCGRSTNATLNLCPACEGELPWIAGACFRCGMERPAASLAGDHCGRCLVDPPPFEQCQSLFSYRLPISRLLMDFKFNGRLETGYALSRLLAERMLACYRIAPPPDVLIPIPMHRSRLRERGFNQALEIARVVGRHCAIPVSNDFAVRNRVTPTQTAMKSAAQRRLNMRRAFSINDAKRPSSLGSVALIDDVVTTMATVSEMTKTLKGEGAGRVQVWSLARAER